MKLLRAIWQFAVDWLDGRNATKALAEYEKFGGVSLKDFKFEIRIVDDAGEPWIHPLLRPPYVKSTPIEGEYGEGTGEKGVLI